MVLTHMFKNHGKYGNDTEVVNPKWEGKRKNFSFIPN